MADNRHPNRRFHALVLVVCAFAAVLVTTSSASAASQQVGRPIEGAPEMDSLGQRVAISADGTRVAMSVREGTASLTSDMVLVYELREGEWVRLGEPIRSARWPQSTLAMSADGSSLVIGNPASINPFDGPGAGEVLVYRFGQDWTVVGNPIVGQPGDGGLGAGVAISADGTRVVAGAPHSGFSEGRVRIYDLIDEEEEWAPSAVLVGTGSLGTSVAMTPDGSRIVAGDTGAPSGKLVVYEDVGGTWEQVGDPMLGSLSNEQLGRVVAISDDGRRVAGRGLRSPDDGSAAHVSAFEEMDGVWSPLGARLTGATRTGTRNGGFNDNFGVSLSLSGDGSRLAVGASGTGANGLKSGSVDVFEIGPDGWTSMASFTGPHKGASMGIALALDGDGSRIAIGTPNFDTFNNNAGQLAVFDLGIPGPLCGGLPATLVGTSGIDRLIGTTGSDVIVGLQSNDIIKGLGGDDVICGGTGDDIIFGGQGFDTIFGAQGNDLIYASNSATELGRRDSRGARVLGGAGDDVIHGSNRWDRMQGGTGADQLLGYEGRDWLRGRSGADRIVGGANIDDVHGGDGNDTIVIEGNDRVRGGAGQQDRCEIGANANPSPLISCELR